MAIPKMLKSQVAERLMQEVSRLQAEARNLYFDHMMYEVNDSLTSILAITEVEPKDAIPRIKQYIHRINQSLHSAKNYQITSAGEHRFLLTPLLKNAIKVLNENYPKAKLVTLISDIKAPVQGDQALFERLLFILFVDILGSQGEPTEVLIEARQKDQDALITLLKDHFSYSEAAMDLVNKIIEESPDLRGRVQITPQGNGVEVVIRIPLQFHAISLTRPSAKVEIKTDIKKTV